MYAHARHTHRPYTAHITIIDWRMWCPRQAHQQRQDSCKVDSFVWTQGCGTSWKSFSGRVWSVCDPRTGTFTPWNMGWIMSDCKAVNGSYRILGHIVRSFQRIVGCNGQWEEILGKALHYMIIRRIMFVHCHSLSIGATTIIHRRQFGAAIILFCWFKYMR